MKLPRNLKYIVLFLLMLISELANSQELNCNVQVSAQKIQGSNRHVFQSMQKDIYEFMNNTIWTDNVYSYSERVDCNILINLTDQLSADEFNGTIQIQLSRPVFNTTYNTTLSFSLSSLILMDRIQILFPFWPTMLILYLV